MSDIFGKIFGKDKHQSQQSKEKDKCSSPPADKSGASITASASTKTSDFCTYKQ